MSHGELALITGGAVVLFLVVVLATRGRVQRRIFAGTGLQEWRQVARRLPWSDRWSLSWTTTLGRATSTRLAPLAVQRGEAVAAALARTTTRTSKFRWLFWCIGALGVVNLGLDVAGRVLDGGDGSTWYGLLSALLMIAYGLAYVPLQNAQAKLARRSVSLNQRPADA